MKVLGFLWLIVGWLVIIAAVMLLPSEQARSIFFIAGFVLESLGLGLFVRSHISHKKERDL